MESNISRITYHIVEHDGGWAYKADGVFSETFTTRSAALSAARKVAEEQRTPGATHTIEYEDESGKWHTEIASGRDRPETSVDEK